MKSENLKNALKNFNQAQLGKNSKIEILNPNEEGTIKGGALGCPCRRNQTVTCQGSYSQSK